MALSWQSQQSCFVAEHGINQGKLPTHTSDDDIATWLLDALQNSYASSGGGGDDCVITHDEMVEVLNDLFSH